MASVFVPPLRECLKDAPSHREPRGIKFISVFPRETPIYFLYSSSCVDRVSAQGQSMGDRCVPVGTWSGYPHADASREHGVTWTKELTRPGLCAP
jgi:hypothetical protein